MQSDADIDAGVDADIDAGVDAVSLAASGRYGTATGWWTLRTRVSGTFELWTSPTTSSLTNLLYSDALLGRRPTYIYTPVAESLNL